MQLSKSQGIVLASHPLGEADVYAIIITKNYGIKKFIFKGIRKSKKRDKSATEIGSIITISFYPNNNKDLITVSEFATLKHNYYISQDLNKIYHLSFILELIKNLTIKDHVDDQLFFLLYFTIEELKKSTRIIHVTAFFIIRFTTLIGLLPQIDYCSICGKKHPSMFSFNENSFEMHCTLCSPCYNPLTSISHDFISESTTKKFNTIETDKFSDEELSNLIIVFATLLENYFKINLKTKEFIQSSF